MKVHTRGCLEVLGYQVSHLDTIWITLGHYFLRHLDIGELHGYAAWIPSGVTEIHKSRLIVKIFQLSENSSAIGGLTFIVALIQIHKYTNTQIHKYTNTQIQTDCLNISVV